MKIDKNIKCCPYCGSEQYYIKQSFKGTCCYHIRFDGKEAENGDLWDNTHKSPFSASFPSNLM